MNNGEFRSPHLGDSTLRALLQGEQTVPGVGAHFLKCAECQERLRELAPEEATPFLSRIRALSRKLRHMQEDELVALVRETASEVASAEALIEEALRLPDAASSLRSNRVSPHALGVALLEIAPRLRQEDPATLLAVCREVLAQNCESPTPVPGQAAYDVVAQLEAECGNALRILSKHAEASVRITRALNLVRSSPDHLVRAKVRWLASLYFMDVSCFREAELLARYAKDTFTTFGRRNETERASYALAKIPYYRGELDDALRSLRVLLKQDLEDPLTELSAVHLTAKILTLKGEYFPAGRLLSPLRKLSQPWRDSPGIQMNIQWVRGLIVAGSGGEKQGIRLLEEVRDFYIGEGIHFDAALVMVDLAYWRLQVGQRKEAIEDSAGAVRIFEIEKTEFPQALAAVRLFAEAVRDDHLEKDLYRELAVYLDRSRRDPELTFDSRETP